MIRRHLHWQIYLTIIASLLAVAVISAVLLNLFGGRHYDRQVAAISAQMVQRMLPGADAPDAMQREALMRIGNDLGITATLYDADWNTIASTAPAYVPFPRKWRDRHHRRGPAWRLRLSDGRMLIVDLRKRGVRHPLWGLLLFLGAAALVVGLVSYPVVRRLTRRLERLQAGVERIGDGDLTARVNVAGKDEIARLATSFNAAAERIETLLGAHRMLLANASHELRTPLARIRLGLEMLDQEPSDARREALQQDIAELDMLIEEILLMSRLDTGTEADRSQGIDLLALIAEEAAHYPDCEVSGAAPDFPGDPRLLQRMVRNLLDNAHKHGKPPVSIRLDAVENAVCIIMADGGDGIPQADRAKVFDPFYRGSDRQNVAGYGLGLPLVRQIAEAHQGTVEIDDTGSTLRVRLPIGVSTT